MALFLVEIDRLRTRAFLIACCALWFATASLAQAPGGLSVPAGDSTQQMQLVQPPPEVPPNIEENRPTPQVRGATAMPSTLTGSVLGSGTRRVRAFPRTSLPFNFNSSMTPDGERQWIFSGGINLVVEEIETGNTVDIVADRAVVWTRGDVIGDPAAGGIETTGDRQIEAYLEGNVTIRQGNPSKVNDVSSVVLFGKQVYFNVNTNQALVLDGAVEAYEPRIQVPIYMTSEEIRQLAPGELYGRNAGFSTSVHRGTPGYAITGREFYFEEIRQRIRNPFTGNDVVDTTTGQPMEVSRHFLTGYTNVLRVNDYPIFFWPYVRANAEDPLGPVQDFRFGSSNNLGVMATLTLDVWQLLGLDYLPIADNTNWLFDVGYFSDRGPAVGSRFNYFGQGLLSQEDSYWGNSLNWYIHDEGVDNLGQDRDDLEPTRRNRYRSRWQHRHDFTDDTNLIAEYSFLSDPNLLESFFEAEYDAGKDQDTLLYAKHSPGDWAVTGLLQPKLRDWLPQNQWLPRGDFYWLGQPLFGDRVTYFTHSSVGYGILDPPSIYTLPTDARVELGRLDTRHELNLPVSLGPWQVTPFAIGQFTGYTSSPADDALGRLYGAAGVRTSLPFYRIYPGVESGLFNLHGLAHKVSLNADYLFARSSESFEDLPLMDQLHDDTSELVMRQNILRSFGGVLPRWYDPRFQALRRNIIGYPEALDDNDQFRFSITQRLQTKRGPIGKQRIIDWMYLDIGTSVFPNGDRDNEGETFGLVSYSYLWNIGDRLNVTSDATYEPFEDQLQVGAGINMQRPPRSTFSILFSHFDSGPFQSDYIGAATSYRFSTRYAGAFEIGQDLQAAESVNVRANFSRIGLDFVTTFGVVWNAGRDDFGVEFSILPRVAVRNTYGRSALQTLPFGVEPAAQIVPSTLDRLAIMNANTF